MSNAATQAFSVVQVGPVPPPYGGVSVHIQRLHERLRQIGISSKVYTPPLPTPSSDPKIIESLFPPRFGGLTWFLQQGWKIRADIVHYQYGLHWSPSIFASTKFRHKLVVTCHDQMLLENYRRASPAIRWAARKIVRSKKVRWIAVSAVVKDQLMELGAEDSRISVIPAFIPPSSNAGDAASLPAEMRSFLDSHRPILSVYGWQLSRDNEGVDLYGIDMCIDLLAKLKPDYPGIGLIACIPVIPDPDYFKELKRRTKDRGLEHNLFFYDRSLPEAYPLWQASDIYLRPTTTDGDAVAVREALSLGVPVVASDASRRPDGVVIFPKRDGESFAKAVGETLQNPRAAKEAAKASIQNDFFGKVLDIYREAAQKPLVVKP